MSQIKQTWRAVTMRIAQSEHVLLMLLLIIAIPQQMWADGDNPGYHDVTVEYKDYGMDITFNSWYIYYYHHITMIGTYQAHFYDDAAITVTIGKSSHVFHLSDLSTTTNPYYGLYFKGETAYVEGNNLGFYYKDDASFPKKVYEDTKNNVRVIAYFHNQRNGVSRQPTDVIPSDGDTDSRWCAVDFTVKVFTQSAASVNIKGKWQFDKDWKNPTDVNWTVGPFKHTCNTDSRTLTYPLVPSTCSKGGIYYESCSLCGAKQTETYESTYLLPHTVTTGYDKNGYAVCDVCSGYAHESLASPVNGYYEIKNAGQLYSFADLVKTDPYANGKLTNDIIVNDGTFDMMGNFTATGAKQTSEPHYWTPMLQVQNQEYMGTFDGNGHYIRGLRGLSANTSESYMAFINAATNATVKNLGFKDCYFCGISYVGTLIGRANGCQIKNCYAEGIIKGASHDGGLVGALENGCVLSESWANCSCAIESFVLPMPHYHGGLCGVSTNSTINNCYAELRIDTSQRPDRAVLGGLLGMNEQNGTVSNCYSTLIVDGTGREGIVGTQEASMTNCYDTYRNDRFGSGAIAYELNNSAKNKGVWGQDIASQPRPLLTGDGVRYTRQMDLKWGTLALPFRIKTNPLDDRYYKFYNICSVDGNVITLEQIQDGELNAGTPVIIKLPEQLNRIELIPYTGVGFWPINELVYIEGSSARGITMKGTFVRKDITNEPGYVYRDGRFVSIGEAKGPLYNDRVYCEPFHAYFYGMLQQTYGTVHELYLEEQGGTVAVGLIDALNDAETEYYDLNGRRLDNLQPGTNIVKRGGKTVKVIVK